MVRSIGRFVSRVTLVALITSVSVSAATQGESHESKGAFFGKLGVIRPQNAFFSGNFSYFQDGVNAVLKADSVQNTGPAPATFRFSLWLTAAPWPSAGTNTASYTIGTLTPGQVVTNVNAAGTGVPFTSPGTGCWYVTLVLEELINGTYTADDYAQFSKRADFYGCVTSFTANPPSIAPGASSTLSWNALAGSVSIDNGIGAQPLSGSIVVHPAATTSYTLTLSGTSNTFPTTNVATVNVAHAAPTATLSASPTTISPGQSSTLTWSTTNATSVTIDHGIGTVAASGTMSVSPSVTTTYTLTATGSGGTVTSAAAVSVSSPQAPTASLTASPNSITAGNFARLSWSATNATAVTIDHGIGAVPTSGTVSVSPAVTTTYTLSATGAGGSVTASTVVSVAAACVAPVVTISSSPTRVIAGDPLTLTASTTSNIVSYVWYRGNAGDSSGGPIGSGATFTTTEVETTSYWVRSTEASCGIVADSAALSVALDTGSCTASSDLCLNGNRYKVSLVAKDGKGATATGLALYQTNSFGFFSLPSFTGDAKNPEVFLKIVGPVNGVPWIFYSGLTNLDYTISITDTTTGKAMTPYHVAPPPAGSLTSKGDYDVGGVASSHCDPVAVTTRQDLATGSCTADGNTLCLLSKRFRVTLTAHDDPARTGKTDTGASTPRADAFGFFSLPGLSGDPKNLEVFVKMVNATTFDGHYWVFLGGLTDVETTVTITDVTNGKTRIYKKPLSSTCGWNDTAAF